MVKRESKRNPPSLYRVYKSTLQRVPLTIKALSSFAAFLLVVDEEKKVFGWIGSDANPTDAELALELGNGVLQKDYHQETQGDFPFIQEGSESVPILETFMDFLGVTTNTYFSKLVSSSRRQEISNSSVSVGLIEKNPETNELEFNELAFAHTDLNGTVPRVSFVPVEIKTAAYVNIGDQWNLWFSRGVGDVEEEEVINFVDEKIISQLKLTIKNFDESSIDQYVQVIHQGEERFLFRRPLKIFTDFEPPGKTLPKPFRLPRAGEQPVDDPAEEKSDRGAFEQKDHTQDRADLYPITRGNKGEEEKKIDEPHRGLNKKASSRVRFAIGDEKPGFDDKSQVSSVNPGSQETGGPVADFWATPATVAAAMETSKDTSVAEAKHNKAKKQEDDILVDQEIRLELDEEEEAAGGTPKKDKKHNFLLTEEMLEVIESSNISPEQRSALIAESIKQPDALVGWQVAIDEGLYAGIFVITKSKKTLLGKTKYFLQTKVKLRGAGGVEDFQEDSFWLRLKRGPKKEGTKFRPLRKVSE